MASGFGTASTPLGTTTPGGGFGGASGAGGFGALGQGSGFGTNP